MLISNATLKLKGTVKPQEEKKKERKVWKDYRKYFHEKNIVNL